MINSFIVSGLISSLSLFVSASGYTHATEYSNNKFADANNSAYLALPTCKTGTKLGKTPISLVNGAKVSCYNIKNAAAGKKLLTSDTSKTCFACHSSGGVSPFKSMNSNLRTQSYTLKPTSISAAFRAHSGEMSGAKMSASEAKLVSHFLQSIK